MRKFEWSVSGSQIFTDDYDTQSLEGAAVQFNKNIGTGFIMLAPSRTMKNPLTIHITDQGRVTWPNDIDSRGFQTFIHIEQGVLQLINEQGDIYFGGTHPDYPLTLDMDISGGGLIAKANTMIFMTTKEEVVTQVRNTGILSLSANLVSVYSKIEAMDEALVEINALSILAGKDGISHYANSEMPCFSLKSGRALFMFRNKNTISSPFDFINNAYYPGIFNFETNGPNSGGFHFENLGINNEHINQNLNKMFKNSLISINGIPEMEQSKFNFSFPNNGRDVLISLK